MLERWLLPRWLAVMQSRFLGVLSFAPHDCVVASLLPRHKCRHPVRIASRGMARCLHLKRLAFI